MNVNVIPEWPQTEQTEWSLALGSRDEETGRTYPPCYVTRILTRFGEQTFQCAVSMAVDDMIGPDERRAELIARKMETAQVALRDVVQQHIKSLRRE